MRSPTPLCGFNSWLLEKVADERNEKSGKRRVKVGSFARKALSYQRGAPMKRLEQVRETRRKVKHKGLRKRGTKEKEN